MFVTIKYIPTGQVFKLPKEYAKDLKEKFPDEYRIIRGTKKKV